MGGAIIFKRASIGALLLVVKVAGAGKSRPSGAGIKRPAFASERARSRFSEYTTYKQLFPEDFFGERAPFALLLMRSEVRRIMQITKPCVRNHRPTNFSAPGTKYDQIS